jgi:hypothetical protein
METKPRSRKPVKVALIAVACIGLALASVAVVFLAKAPLLARRIFTKSEAIQVGKSTFTQAQQVAEQFENTTHGGCTPSECEWMFGTSNSDLPHWWRDQGEIFLVRIHVKDGRVDQKDLLYLIGLGSVMSDVGVSEKEDWTGSPRAPRWTEGEGTQGVHKIENVRLTPSNSAETRKRYTSLTGTAFGNFKDVKMRTS